VSASTTDVAIAEAVLGVLRERPELAAQLRRLLLAVEQQPSPGRLLDARQAARRLGCCEETLLRAARAGRLRCYRVGRAIRFDPADLDAWARR